MCLLWDHDLVFVYELESEGLIFILTLFVEYFNLTS